MPIIKRKKTVILIVLAFILVANWPLVKNVTGLNDGYYRYSNQSGTYTALETPIQNRMYKKPPGGRWIINAPNWYSCKAMPQTDTVVYRLFKINPLKFWRWGEYIFDWRYRMPYENWEEIEKRRGFGPLKVSKDCMVF